MVRQRDKERDGQIEIRIIGGKNKASMALFLPPIYKYGEGQN